MWGGTRLMDHMCWTTDRQVCRAGLRAGRFVEQDYERGGWKALGLSSPFLFVYGDDRVIRYMGADVGTGDAKNAQATE
ncbi:hypothetical protein DEO72_LG10g1651 [Vigna unguiculata]|uniref:Uncharacterized protein n=1 Tax=Vigna unguiculata TaxID=3917 RepID=A0A4D6NC11_VIGUN|nr:hypothetical protein DEO72_LG10g1651 [Vigna unguiculata]